MNNKIRKIKCYYCGKIFNIGDISDEKYACDDCLSKEEQPKFLTKPNGGFCPEKDHFWRQVCPEL